MLTGTIEQDLKFYLSDYYSHLDVNFYIQQQPLLHNEIFSENGCIVFFFLNVTHTAQTYLTEHYPQDNLYFAIDLRIDKTALCEVVPVGRHNIQDMKVYKQVFLHVLKDILKNMLFVSEGKSLHLDHNYDTFFQMVQKGDITLLSEILEQHSDDRSNNEPIIEVILEDNMAEKKMPEQTLAGADIFLDTEETLISVYINPEDERLDEILQETLHEISNEEAE